MDSDTRSSFFDALSLTLCQLPEQSDLDGSTSLLLDEEGSALCAHSSILIAITGGEDNLSKTTSLRDVYASLQMKRKDCAIHLVIINVGTKTSEVFTQRMKDLCSASIAGGGKGTYLTARNVDQIPLAFLTVAQLILDTPA